MKALIIEDETAAVGNLTHILREVAPHMEIIGSLDSVEESVRWFKEHTQPDLVFMDIHLADGDSFRIFDSVEISSPIIFTTAYDQYALEAFKVNSIDYLLKPINKQEVRRSLEKLERLTQSERQDLSQRIVQMTKQDPTETFLVQIRDRLIPLKRADIAFFYTSNERVSATDFSGHDYPIDKTLEALQTLLPEKDFFRANRQFIIQRDAIQEINIWFGSRLKVHLKTPTPEMIIISKARVSEFKQWLTSPAS